MFLSTLKTKLFFLPLEIKTRELYPKLYFASKALEKNYSFFIGDKAGIFRATKYFNKGVYFYKSINQTDTGHIIKIKNRDNKYIVLDEEGGFTYLSSKDYLRFLKHRSSEINLRLIDKYFNWGKFDNKNCINQYKKQKNKFSISGGLRFEVCKKSVVKSLYKDQIKKINNEYGKNYILVTTSHLTSKKEMRNMIKNDNHFMKLKTKTKKEIKDRFNVLIQLLRLNKEMKSILILLSKNFPNKKFILRPHPSESLDDWKNFFNKNSKISKNISIDTKYDINALIFNSKIVINSKSACGLHAALQKKPVITFVPKLIKYEKRIVDYIGNIAQTKKEIVSNLIKILENKISYVKIKNSKILLDHVNNIGKKNDSSKIILNEVKKIYNSKSNINLLKILLLSPLYLLTDYFFKFLKKGFYDPKLSTLGTRTNLEKMGEERLMKSDIVSFFKNSNQLNKINILSFGKSCFFVYKNIK